MTNDPLGARAPRPAPQRRGSDDPHRPRYHFLPPSAWMNDPNGLIQWKGVYHLFYQYNPEGPRWGVPDWGHAVSRDLVYWTDLPTALAPTPGGADADGCWSGCAVDDDGVPTLVYTGVRDGVQAPCVAVSHDDLLTWEKHPGNPVIALPEPDVGSIMFRDHSVWRGADGLWYQLVGSGLRGQGGAVLLYRSSDLLSWEYLHPLYVGDHTRTEPVWTGAMWECPDFFPLDGRHVLVVSARDEERLHYGAYLVGEYGGRRYAPTTEGMLDAGGCYYAPQSFTDDQGRRIQFGWLWERRNSRAVEEAGWAGVMSLPRVLSLRPDGALAARPAPELAVLRGRRTSVDNLQVAADTNVSLRHVQGDCIEILARFDLGDAERCGLSVRRSPDGEEETIIGYDRAEGALYLDTRRSSQSPDVETDERRTALALEPGSPLELNVFLDRSVIELYATGGVCMSVRVYPTRADSQGVEAFSEGGSSVVLSLEVWEMGSIWEE
ncbi:MAG: glycoside hydrolase family 32 protein [Chloroflexia bacterium]